MIDSSFYLAAAAAVCHDCCHDACHFRYACHAIVAAVVVCFSFRHEIFALLLVSCYATPLRHEDFRLFR